MINKSIDMFEYLIKNGADITIKNNDGKTPLDLCNDEIKTQLLNMIRTIKLDEIYGK